ncbi:hypothetical protein WA026_018312 [Henosepilachna vigintioctopunctata]|uniref:Lipase domain-containing protein n=1 Tax=Henosepilachna vigintioctopunctata TaxID=420089 RepID=A0AAW1VIC5_9CUCU
MFSVFFRMMFLMSLVLASFRLVESDETVNLSSAIFSHTLQSLIQTDFGAQEKVGRDVDLNELKFYLYTSKNRGEETILNPLNPKELTSSRGKIFFLLHSWIYSKQYSTWYNELTNKLLNRYPEGNVVQVDWGSASYQDFGMTAYSTESIGYHIATIMSNLVLKFHVPTENFILIGHAMGAQICGWAGKYFIEHTKKKIGKIVALDPVGILFKDRPDSKKLNRNDAVGVHVIHTDAENRGFVPSGTIDFYPNGGYDQPGCHDFDVNSPNRLLIDVVFCSQARSYEYFIEAIGNPGSFLSHQCANEAELASRDCNGVEVGLGDLDTIRQGIFYLKTNSKPPYSQLSIY